VGGRVADPDQYSESGSGSRRAKMTHKSRKNLRNFMFSSAGCSLLRAEGLYRGLGISIFGHQIPRIQLDPDPDPYTYRIKLIRIGNPGGGRREGVSAANLKLFNFTDRGSSNHEIGKKKLILLPF
jgi:hypothetical protein